MPAEPINGKSYVDLHIHTAYSDGIFTVSEVFEAARGKRMRAISITDHDCLDAYTQACGLAREYNIELIDRKSVV